MTIRLLDSTLINQIAAGEVIERPASAIKELVENALDAKATSIHVQIRDGGRTFMSITDNGIGMTRDDLALCIERHATSKIPDQDLFNIKSLGFRGEALPSIGAVSRLSITTRHQSSQNGWCLQVEGGVKTEPSPTPFSSGTKIEVRDLFYATPARLKFLKTAKTEQTYILEHINRLAMAHPNVHFKLTEQDRTLIDYPAHQGESAYEMRLKDVMGQEFIENSIPILLDREGVRIHGLCSLPTYHRSSGQSQFLFVNGRSVKDKLMVTAVRISYQDFLPSNRHPLMALYLQVPYEEVDINVHPAKAEVRFRDTQLIRSLIISSVKNALDQASNRMATTVSSNAIAAFERANTAASAELRNQSLSTETFTAPLKSAPPHLTNFTSQFQRRPSQNLGSGKASNFSYSSFKPEAPGHSTPSFSTTATARKLAFNFQQEAVNQSSVHPTPPAFIEIQETESNTDHPLGLAKAQLHSNYIIAQKKDGLVIVDQHAAHERLIYEGLKKQIQEKGVQTQPLLIPHVVRLTTQEADILFAYLTELAKFGLIIEPFGEQEALIREVPALLGQIDYDQLIHDLVGEMEEFGQGVSLHEHLNELLGTIACHHSIRSGRLLSINEMNALLRQIESTPHSSQCNHGRPTYITLDLKEIEKLFGRR